MAEIADDDVTARTSHLVRDLLARHERSGEVASEMALTDAGLSSLDMVNLMLAVEAEFDVFIPPAAVSPGNFRSIASIAAMVTGLKSADAVTA